VAECNHNYRKAPFSKYGGPASIVAPGQDIVSCGIKDDYIYVPKNGTSMAAPFVVGILALFVGYEGLDSDAYTAYSRLAANRIPEVITGFPDNPPTANDVVDFGWNNPNKTQMHRTRMPRPSLRQSCQLRRLSARGGAGKPTLLSLVANWRIRSIHAARD
jgi:hypothetical protein